MAYELLGAGGIDCAPLLALIQNPLRLDFLPISGINKPQHNMIKKLLISMVAIAGASSLWATDFDFSGVFTKDNDIATFTFTVGAGSTVKVFSSSWDDGGFDPILAIWTSAGVQMAQQDDGGISGSTVSNAVSYDHGVWDSYYSVFLSAGSYIATVAQYNNFSVSSLLSDGFIHDGNPNFTFTNGWGSQPYFNGVWNIPNDPRTGNYAFHILNVDSATHEPPGVPDYASTLMLLTLAFSSMLVGRKLRA